LHTHWDGKGAQTYAKSIGKDNSNIAPITAQESKDTEGHFEVFAFRVRHEVEMQCYHHYLCIETTALKSHKSYPIYGISTNHTYGNPGKILNKPCASDF
jgi:hypothetical protein